MSTDRIPARIARLTIAQADAFYDARVSSVEAFRAINSAARSAWNYYDGIFNDTHRLFEAHVDERISADVDSWKEG